jgi:alanine racemase
VVTNVSATQLQYFGSVASLAAELTQLPRALPAAGFAVLNSDDPAVRAMGSDTEANLRFFGALSDTVDADDLRRTVRCTLAPMAASNATALALTFPQAGTRYPDGGRAIFHHLHGDHWANAVLAALTVGEALGVELDVALDALVELRPLPGRLNWLAGAHHLIVLDDSHNAAPASMRAGLDALAAVGRAQPSGAARIAVLGDMLRLGDTEMDAHHQVGQQAFATATHLVTVGSRAEWIAQAALTAGMPAERVAVTRSHDDAARAVLGFAANPTDRTSAGIDHDARQWRPDAASVVLIKGSEDIRMERITSQLLAQPERAEELLDRQTPGWQRVVMMRPDRPTWLEVDLDAIARNTRLIKELVGPEVAVLVSLKADAYGHGALPVARTVLRNGASWLGVATVSEARPLRQAGITAPMLIFGYTAPWQAREAVHLDLSITVFSIEAAQALSRAACELQRTVRVHVKIDTGMGRLGLRAENVRSIIAFFEELEILPGLVVEGMFTHFSSADSADPSYTQRQIARFARVLDGLERHNLRPAIVHAANSAATLAWPEMRYNLVRPGIAIYGLSPSEAVRLPFGFRPALAFRTQVVQLSELAAGEGISYGATYVTEGPTRVATLPVGYADGFRRGPTTWGEVLVRGQRAPLIGRVCMDQCMIDVTRIADVRVGDEVTLIGQQGDDELTAEAVAARLGTIHYEVVAELLARVPRVS